MEDSEEQVIAFDATRAAQIKRLDVGESVSVVRRIEIKYGFGEGALAHHAKQIRGIVDQQAHRARKQMPSRKFKVENGTFLTQDGALIICAAITRTE